MSSSGVIKVPSTLPYIQMKHCQLSPTFLYLLKGNEVISGDEEVIVVFLAEGRHPVCLGRVRRSNNCR